MMIITISRHLLHTTVYNTQFLCTDRFVGVISVVEAEVILLNDAQAIKYLVKQVTTLHMYLTNHITTLT